MDHGRAVVDTLQGEGQRQPPFGLEQAVLGGAVVGAGEGGPLTSMGCPSVTSRA
ncbi:hypothetical protein AB0O76_18155 [Streptomyces sp. NPDC086554]|uniref:hypothetical protein n=1 Tax=Streptomyces sp. NPDC086554 TaxID=3154864 RepID=UPI00343C944D